MASNYRLYFLDAPNHIVAANDVECSNDGAAIAHAMNFADIRNLELWSQARLVARISGKTAQTLVAAVIDRDGIF
jgi:hypothetical protein